MSLDSGTPVEIVAVGRELLTGRVADTNSAWVAARLTDAGARVARIVTVDDDPGDVARAIGDARRRDAALVVTTGGLGPTVDDVTLAGVALAVGRALVESPEALVFVGRRYAEIAAAGAVADAALTPSRRKMAALPAGAEMLANPVGTAPGVLIGDDGFTVVALPGVPEEMRAMLAAAWPRLEARLGAPAALAERDVASGSGDESVIGPALERVMAAMPDVHLKSFATTFAPDADLRVRISARAADRVTAERRVAGAAARLAEELARLR